MKRVAVTGIGMIDTLGNNYNDCSSSFLSDNYIDPVPYDWCPVEEYRTQKVFPVTSDLNLPDIHLKTLKTFDNNLKYGLHAVHQALQDSGVEHSNNVAVVASNVTSGDEIMSKSVLEIHEHGRMKRPRHFLAGMKDFFPGVICQQWEFNGLNIAMNAACATALFNIDYAMRIVDEYDYVVCALSDAPINELAVPFFTGIGALGTRSIPFEEGRDGFIPGDGGACFILESEERAKARGANIHAYLHPVGFGSDAHGATAPCPAGTGAKLAMKKAIAYHNIDFVCAHGTSTPLGDQVEQESIKELLGEKEIVAPKRKIGHTMGTSGMLETIYGIMLLKHRNKPGKFLNNSFGFGGKCASQIIEVE